MPVFPRAAGDSLSQWRAYADDGRGVAFGICRAALNGIVKQRKKSRNTSESLRLENVVYRTKKQEQMVRDIIDAALENHPEDKSLIGRLPKELTDDLFASIAKEGIWFDAARCKNGCFREEREVRLIYKPSAKTPSPLLGQRRFRSGGDKRIPYYALPIPTEVDDSKTPPILCKIVFGPKSAHKHNRRVIHRLLAENGYNVKQIRCSVSEATYR